MALSDDALAIAASQLAHAEISALSIGKSKAGKLDNLRAKMADAYLYWRDQLRTNGFIHSDSPP